MAAEQTFEPYRKPAHREEFLTTLEVIVPWAELCEVIEPYYPKAGNARPPLGLERMLRGLNQNSAQLFTLLAPSNLWMVRKKLMGVWA